MFMLTNRGERSSDIFVREGNKLLLLLLLLNQLKLDKSGIQGIVSKDQRKRWSIMQISYLVND